MRSPAASAPQTCLGGTSDSPQKLGERGGASGLQQTMTMTTTTLTLQEAPANRSTNNEKN